MQLNSTFVFFLFSFLIFLLSSFVQAQVIIKEKVEINPQGSYTSDSPIQEHTVRVDLEWTPSNVEGSIIFYDLFCTTPNSSWSGTSSNGSISFSHTKNGYEYYHIQFRFYPCTLFPYPNPHHIQGTYKIYYDGRLMRTSPFEINGYCAQGDFNSIYNTAFRPPLITKYTFDMTGGDLCYGHSSDVYIKGENTDCSNFMEIDTSLVKTIKLEILDGKEFASFYQDGVKKDTATIRYDNLNMGTFYIDDISLRADSSYNGTQPLDVIVKSNWADEIRYDTIKINPQTPTQIYVSDEQPIIVRFGTIGIQVKTYSSYGGNGCWAEMPDSIKYRAVITKGQNLGNLFDYNTGSSGDMLINLSHNNGQTVIGFITEGENLTEVDTVIVSISTTDPNINTVQAMLLIQPNDINVTIIPGIISQGDTARVVLKKNGQNGLEPFPTDKLFNVEIINGAEYGLILDSLSNDTLTIFENILQGFKIIAKDSTGIDSTKIRIKVTTEESGFPVVRMIRNNTKTNKKEIVDDNANQKSDDEIITPDWIIPGPILLEGFGDVVVKQDECDFDNCGDSYDDIQITLLTQPNGFQHAIYQLILENGSVKGAVVDVDTTTVCDLDSANIKNGVVGQSTPVPYSRLRKNTSSNWEKSWILSPCKNDTGAIEYRTITKDSVRTPIYLDFVADVCYDLIAADTSNLTLVNDTTALKDTSIIKDATIAFHDICGHLCYPQIISNNGYVIKEIIYRHELLHSEQYKKILDSLRTEFLIKPLKESQTKTCEWLNFIKNAENDSSDFENIIYKYTDRATQTYYKISGLSYIDEYGNVQPRDTVQELKNERRIHYVPVIENLVLDYLEALHYARGTPLQVTSCMSCPK